MKKLLVSLVSVLLIVINAAPVQADQWSFSYPPLTNPDDYAGIEITDSFVDAENSSRLHAVITDSKTKYPEMVLCDGFGVGDCDFRRTTPTGVLLYPACQESGQTACIESLGILTSAGPANVSFVRQTLGPTVKADSARGLPFGGTVSLWEAVGSESSTPTKYAVYASQRIIGFEKGKYKLGDLAVTVLPYRESQGSYTLPSLMNSKDADGRRYVSILGGGPGCAWTEEGVCGRIQDFGDDLTVSVKVRAPKSVGGWFRGRMSETDIAVDSSNSSFNSLTVTGKPVDVPQIAFIKPKSEISQKFFDALDRQYSFWGSVGIFSTLAYYDSPEDGKLVDAIRGEINDTAAGVVRTWSFVATGSSGNKCLSDTSKILGIVTTNASVFQRTAPDYSRGFLNYKVAAMHFLPGGEEELKGTYNLVMRSEVARCLYKFSKAPLSATITVAGEGDTNIATTVFGEKDGWVKLGAYGFTFSNKTIRVKLSQKKSTIVCISTSNPKKTKRVTSLSPRCPAGYKKP